MYPGCAVVWSSPARQQQVPTRSRPKGEMMLRPLSSRAIFVVLVLAALAGLLGNIVWGT
jgi:hypothetical protein